MIRILFLTILLSFSISGRSQGNFFWSHTGVTAADTCYSYLYNWYTGNDGRELAASGWHVPTLSEIQALADELGASGNYLNNSVGGELKEVGFTYWDSPNTGATNSTGFSMRAGGFRHSTGVFLGIRIVGHFWASDRAVIGEGYKGTLSSINDYLLCDPTSYWTETVGISVRLLKDDSTLADYTGNDGKVYSSVKIGTQVWMSENLEETEYRNGDPVPNVTDNTAWGNLTTGAWCVYDNDNKYKCK